MKRSLIIILALVLTMAVFTGCRRKTAEPTTAPTTMPTTAATTAPTTASTTAPTTRPTTAPTTQPTMPSENETIEGGIDDTQGNNGEDSGKARRMMPRGF